MIFPKVSSISEIRFTSKNYVFKVDNVKLFFQQTSISVKIILYDRDIQKICLNII